MKIAQAVHGMALRADAIGDIALAAGRRHICYALMPDTLAVAIGSARAWASSGAAALAIGPWAAIAGGPDAELIFLSPYGGRIERRTVGEPGVLPHQYYQMLSDGQIVQCGDVE